MTRFALVSMTAAIAAFALPSLAAAQSAQPTAREIVRFADLNLNRESDVRSLARRLDNTVDYVCGGQPSSAAERGANADYKVCRAATMTAALRAIDKPLLTATVEGRRLLQLATR